MTTPRLIDDKSRDSGGFPLFMTGTVSAACHDSHPKKKKISKTQHNSFFFFFTHVERLISLVAELTLRIRSSHLPRSCADSTRTCCRSFSAATSSSSSCLTRAIWSCSENPAPGRESISNSTCFDLTTRSRASSPRSPRKRAASGGRTSGSVALGSLGAVGTKSWEALM